MNQFQGSKVRVRCVDCTKLEGNRCASKDVTVSSNKRRTCAAYSFKGECSNRTSLPSHYVPYMDRATRRMVRRLLELGIVPVAGETLAHPYDGEPMAKQALEMPQSTATAAILGVKATEEAQLASPDDGNVPWKPDTQ